MKKNRYVSHILHTLLLVLMLLAVSACRNRHDGTETTPAEIGFYSHRLAEVGNRALIENTDGLKASPNGFGVFGYKVVNTTNTPVFENTKVTHNGSEWEYTPLRYWDRARNYVFATYAPHLATEAAFNHVTGELTISNIPQWQKVTPDAKDYLVANSRGAATDYLNVGGTVALEFKHILSQLFVNIIKDNTLIMQNRTYTIRGLRFGDAGEAVPTDVEANRRNVTYNVMATPATTSFSAASVTGTMTFMDVASDADDLEAGTAQTTLAHYLVAPFASTGNLSLYIDYTIEETGQSDIVKDNQEVPLGISSLESNSKYAFLLRFESGKEVVVKVVQIKDWDTVEVTDDVYNW